MALYALLLRPIGFLAATSLFIAGSAVVLGERNPERRDPIEVAQMRTANAPNVSLRGRGLQRRASS